MAPPTPCRIAAVGGLPPNHGHIRRRSSIPRPTSKLTGARRITTPCHVVTAEDGGKAAAMETQQTIVKPRTYSRSRRASFLPHQKEAPSSFRATRAQPPRLSLPTTAACPQQMDGSNDLSGIHQQLPLRRYSRHSLASLDAMVSHATGKVENKTTISLPGPERGRLIKANTSSCVVKATPPVIPHRQLMAPLGPPLPRSHTMGNLGCFATSASNTPSPSKTSTRTTSNNSKRSKVGVMDALAESRMTDKEIEYFNQVAKELEANRHRLKGGTRVTRVSCNDGDVNSASSTTLTSFRRSTASSDLAADDYGEMTIGDSSKKLAFHGTRLKIVPASGSSISPLVLTPDSGVSMGSGSEKAWEINVKLVSGQYRRPWVITSAFGIDFFSQVSFHEPVQYWRGRFSTLSDRLRSEDYCISSPSLISTDLTQPRRAAHVPKIDNSDSFETDQLRRSLQALRELRASCRTAEAVESFELFAQEINPKSERDCHSKREAAFSTHSTESNPKLLAATSWPKMLGVDKNIAAATMKMINTEPKPKPKPSMTRSKTTGDMIQLTAPDTGSTNKKAAKTGWRRPSYLQAQEEVLANEIAMSAERRARAVAAAQRSARRRSGIGIAIGMNLAHSTITTTTAGSAPTAQAKMLAPAPATKHAPRHSLPPRKTSASNSASTNSTTSGEMLKRVFSESVRGVRRIGRSFPGLGGSGDG
jgi:hypothetical protein